MAQGGRGFNQYHNRVSLGRDFNGDQRRWSQRGGTFDRDDSRGSHIVCVRCLEEKPRESNLTRIQCANKEEHQDIKHLRVWWWWRQGILELYPPGRAPPIRPVPDRIRSLYKLVLCDGPGGRRCRGDACSYPHSVQEKELWSSYLKGAGGLSSGADRPPYLWGTESGTTSVTQPEHQSDTYQKTEHHPGRKSSYAGLSGGKQGSNHPTFSKPRKRRASKVLSDDEVALLSHALVQSNYQEKLKLLLDLEEMAHDRELMERCDGEYELYIESEHAIPPWQKRGSYRSRFGYIIGLNGDQISYATQASRKVTIRLKSRDDNAEYSVDILRYNYYHTEDRLYVAINNIQFKAITNHIQSSQAVPVAVRFELKYQYFDRLRDSVRRVPKTVIPRIVLDGMKQDVKVNIPANLDQYKEELSLDLCSNDQFEALKAINCCTAGEPPLIVTGPFGSGKTRVLALAAHVSLKSHQTPVRLLVCAHQHVSANAFLACFNELNPLKNSYVSIFRVVTDNMHAPTSDAHADQWECTRSVDQLASDQVSKTRYLNQKSKVLVVTTCSTANTLLYKKVFHPGYFTHIYIDEGAQMREPEAVAPLGFATNDTVIVIAGDSHQVGPAMLVLGKEPQECGLSVSLVERLHKVYTEDVPSLGTKYHRALTTNFRCHPDIMSLSGRLFYHAPLTSKVIPHKHAPFPFHFVCSDIDDNIRPVKSGTCYPSEAKMLVQQLKKFSVPGRVFPLDGHKPDTSKFAVASPCRSQLTLINSELGQYNKLNDIRRVPTYDIQGNEYFALFLSTTEPTKKDGSTRNPTKSICDPFVFNTVISRANAVVVSMGNPFVLLRKEKHMVQKYGDRGRCWSNYLKLCLDNGTAIPDPSLKLTKEEWEWVLEPLQARVDKMVSEADKPPLMGVGIVTKLEGISEERVQQKDAELSPKESPSVSDISIFCRDYKVISSLGKGSYGVVFGVKKKFDGGKYAVKIIKLNPRSKRDIKKEVKALAQLNHPRIVRYYTSWTETLPEGWKDMDLWAVLKDSETYTQRVESEAIPSIPTSSDEANSPSTDDSIVTPGTDDSIVTPSTNDSIVTFRNDSHSQNADTTRKPPTMSDMSRVSPESESETEQTNKRRVSVLKDEQTTCLFIQTELCERDTLRDWLSKYTDNRPRKKVFHFMKQILEAVDHIHQKKLMHRDLKPSNILFAREQVEPDGSESLKVGDFGLVTNWEPSAASDISGTGSSSSRRGGRPGAHTASAGTELYRSPEQRAKEKYNSKVDIFTLGLIFFELNYPMVTGHQMNKVFNDLRKSGAAGFPQAFVSSLPNETRLIGAMLDPDPKNRPTAQGIIEGENLRRVGEDIEQTREKFVPFDE